MKEGTWRRGVLAAVIGLGVWAGLARSEEPVPVGLESQKPPAPFLTAWFQRHNCCCASHHNDLGCTSGKADCKFIFGSCRTFFGEPCPQGPSPYWFVPPQSTKLGRCACP
jgi:hypothetical protein